MAPSTPTSFTFDCFRNLTMLLTDQKMKQMSTHTLSLLSHDSAMLLSDGMCQFMAPCWERGGEWHRLTHSDPLLYKFLEKRDSAEEMQN